MSLIKRRLLRKMKLVFVSDRAMHNSRLSSEYYFTSAVKRHCVKSVQIRSFFWSVFSLIQSKYTKIRTRKNCVFGHFSRSEIVEAMHRRLEIGPLLTDETI